MTSTIFGNLQEGHLDVIGVRYHTYTSRFHFYTGLGGSGTGAQQRDPAP